MTVEKKPKRPKRKPGRPPNPEGPRPLLETRVTPQLVAKVDRMAKVEVLGGLSRAAMVRLLLEEAVAAREAKP